MGKTRETVVLGFLGAIKDKRAKAWRPTLELCRGMLVDELILFHQQRDLKTACALVEDLEQASPKPTVTLVQLDPRERWNYDEAYDFTRVFATLQEFADGYRRQPGWDLERRQYLVHLTTGTLVMQACLILAVQQQLIPGELLLTWEKPPVRFQSRTVDLTEPRYAPLDPSRRGELEAQRRQVLAGDVNVANPQVKALLDEVLVVAEASSDPILLTGETGVGKTWIAERIHKVKAKALNVGAFVPLNCATLRGDLGRSDLFGHVAGAFTGAIRDRKGALRSAVPDRRRKGRTPGAGPQRPPLVFLDEVGTLDLDMQAMLLKALEEKHVRPVGADVDEPVDFQLVAATHVDLDELVRQGRFRLDLLQRLTCWRWCLPPLRERREDVPSWVDAFLNEWAKERGERRDLSARARIRYLDFAQGPAARWEGNLRALRWSVRRMATLAVTRGARAISVELVDEELRRLRTEAPEPPTLEEPGGLPETLRGLVREDRWRGLTPLEQMRLRTAVDACRGATTATAAGRVLYPRSKAAASSLSKLLARFDLTFEQISAL